jgi:hypothetical protein
MIAHVRRCDQPWWTVPAAVAQEKAPDVRGTAKGMENIKKHLAAEFRRIFVQELQTKGGYEVVDAP